MTTEEAGAPFAIGDPVKVYDLNGSRRGQPPGGWDGTVSRIGRTLIHITYPGYKGGREPQAFGKATQVAQNTNGHRSFLARVHAEFLGRRAQALRTLSEYGLVPLAGREHPLPMLEALVDTLRTITENEE